MSPASSQVLVFALRPVRVSQWRVDSLAGLLHSPGIWPMSTWPIKNFKIKADKINLLKMWQWHIVCEDKDKYE